MTHFTTKKQRTTPYEPEAESMELCEQSDEYTPELAHAGSASPIEVEIPEAQNMDELTDSMPKMEKYFTLQCQNEILQALAYCIQRHLIARIKSESKGITRAEEQPVYSLILDETSDINRKEQVSFCLVSAMLVWKVRSFWDSTRQAGRMRTLFCS